MSRISHPGNCYTIGYGNSPIEVVVNILTDAGIDTVVDVRSSPHSRFNPNFNRGSLEKFLNSSDIGYRYMGDTIGGRYSNPALLFTDGTVDYRKVSVTELFKDGIRQVISFVSGGKRIALMCAEKDPERCHRFSLISRDLKARGINVVHILPDGNVISHDDLEKELVDLMIDMKQRSLLDETVNPVDLMYEKLNKRSRMK